VIKIKDISIEKSLFLNTIIGKNGLNNIKVLNEQGNTMVDFEVLPHMADIKIRVYGKTQQELFKHALIGMFQAIRPIIPEGKIEHDRVICDIMVREDECLAYRQKKQFAVQNYDKN